MHPKQGIQTDCIIIGAGASGLMAAATAGQRGRKVVLLDHKTRPAEKLRISGGGRCNFTNLDMNARFYQSENPHFCRSALARYTPQHFIELMQHYGLTTEEKKPGQLFCAQGAGALIEMLHAECREAGIKTQFGTQIFTIQKHATGFTVETSHGVVQSETVLIATGGLSIPQTGATPFAYQIAQQFNLEVTPLSPALVPLSFQPEDFAPFKALSGLSLDVEVTLGRHAFRDAVLLTHKGLSGPAILQISSFWKPGLALSIDLLPDHPLRRQEQALEKKIDNWLGQFLPKRFAEAWIHQHNIDGTQPLKHLSEKKYTELVEALHQWKVQPNGSLGYKKAEVTLGGVSTQHFSSQTMECKTVKGLFYAGEALDVTGELGGYNLHWAWASGVAAGKAL